MMVNLSSRHKFADALLMAQELGSWAAYATYSAGLPETGDIEMDKLLEELENIGERVYKRSNELSLMYELPLFNDS